MQLLPGKDNKTSISGLETLDVSTLTKQPAKERIAYIEEPVVSGPESTATNVNDYPELTPMLPDPAVNAADNKYEHCFITIYNY